MTERDFQNPFKKIENPQWQLQAQRYSKVMIEIGAGVGLHPVTFAKRHPDYFVIAIEKTTNKYQKMLRRHQHHPQLTNLLPVHANAIQWIAENVGIEQVDEFFILYPNPYPKTSQKNKRFTDMPFMRYLWKCLKLNGNVTLATNEHFYFKESHRTWQPFLNILTAGPVAAEQQPRTHFEKKYLARGETCFEIIATKLDSLD